MTNLLSLLAVTVRGVAIPIVWIIGALLIVAGVIDLFRARFLRAIILIIIGIILGGLNIFVL